MSQCHTEPVSPETLSDTRGLSCCQKLGGRGVVVLEGFFWTSSSGSVLLSHSSSFRVLLCEVLSCCLLLPVLNRSLTRPDSRSMCTIGGQDFGFSDFSRAFLEVAPRSPQRGHVHTFQIFSHQSVKVNISPCSQRQLISVFLTRKKTKCHTY